jgi:2-aminoadipate transaminase
MSQPPSDQWGHGPGAEWLSAAVGRSSSSAIRQLLALVERPDIISLAGGLPSPGLFPVAETRRVIDHLLGADPGALQYATTEGEPALREWIAARQRVAADRVLVTHGSQQALDLVARTTVDPGTAVALADPGYVGAIQALRVHGARLVALPADADGLDTEALAALLRGGLRPRLVYVVPNFANPTGASLSAARARQLADLADRFGFLIVEDDPYGAIRFSGPAAPGLATLSDRVITVGTISKVLFPGLRVGWMVAPAALAPVLALMKQAMDLHTATLNQRIALQLLQRPEFEAEHLPRLRAHYGRQASVLAEALVTELGDAFTFARPQGGMFLWGQVQRPGIDTAALLPTAIDHGVAYVPGSAFSVEARHASSLRLSFATVAPDQLVLGARRLADVLLARTDRAPAVTGSGPTSR